MNSSNSWLPTITAIFGSLGLLCLFSQNPLMSLAAMSIPPLIYYLLWRPGEPPLLAFAAAFQWLQAASPVISANLEGRAIADQPIGSFLSQASWLSLGAIVAITAGMAFAVRGSSFVNPMATSAAGNRMSSKKLFLAYLFSLVLSVGFTWVSQRCLLYTSPSPRDLSTSRMPSSA